MRELVAKTDLEGDLASESREEPRPLPAALQERDALDLDQENITTILWATGYAYDYGWVELPVFDDRGRPVQQRGVTQVPRLIFPGPALDAHLQVRPVLRRRRRREVPRRSRWV